MHEDNITKTKLSVCVDEGYLYKKDKKHVWTFSGYSVMKMVRMEYQTSIFPRSVVKKIEVINEDNLYHTYGNDVVLWRRK